MQKSLFKLSGVHDVTAIPGKNKIVSCIIHSDSNRDLCPDIFQMAKKENWQVHELRREVRTLEAVFNELATAKGGVQ